MQAGQTGGQTYPLKISGDQKERKKTIIIISSSSIIIINFIIIFIIIIIIIIIVNDKLRYNDLKLVNKNNCFNLHIHLSNTNFR